MVRLFNTLEKRMQTFHPVDKDIVTIFTCGPSVYQKAHIGNFRTFLFEDILARYLEYLGYVVRRGMNMTDIEDKALGEAEKQKKTVQCLTGENVRTFMHEMRLLRMKIPDYLPRASECVQEASDIIERLLERKRAYWHRGNVYFDPLRFPEFGRLFGLDMAQWPRKRRRFHKDTYPGMQWNYGDFILWHGYKKRDRYYWNTALGKGRPSWNVQDPSMIMKHFHDTLSVYCGGIDNLFRHHDYTRAILESIRSYPMSRYWLHCNHLYVNGKKMSKSKGNILYFDDLRKQGYKAREIRFFLIYGRYREKLKYSDKLISRTVNKLRSFKRLTRKIEEKATEKRRYEDKLQRRIKMMFIKNMNDDLDIKDAFDDLYGIVLNLEVDKLNPHTASGIMSTLREIDEVFQVGF
jgi:cysteinyl-tRNA synthetase